MVVLVAARFEQRDGDGPVAGEGDVPVGAQAGGVREEHQVRLHGDGEGVAGVEERGGLGVDLAGRAEELGGEFAGGEGAAPVGGGEEVGVDLVAEFAWEVQEAGGGGGGGGKGSAAEGRHGCCIAGLGKCGLIEHWVVMW